MSPLRVPVLSCAHLFPSACYAGYAVGIVKELAHFMLNKHRQLTKHIAYLARKSWRLSPLNWKLRMNKLKERFCQNLN